MESQLYDPDYLDFQPRRPRRGGLVAPYTPPAARRYVPKSDLRFVLFLTVLALGVLFLQLVIRLFDGKVDRVEEG